MSKRLFGIVAASAVLAGAAAAQPGAGDALRDDIDFARGKVYPALVNIQVVVRQFGGGRTQRGPAAGSGVIVSPAGHVLTNFHVAGHTTRIVCRLPDGEAIQADVLAHDPLTDLSVLKLRLDERADSTTPLPFATLGDSEALAVGDYVLAMGNPLSLSSSLTLGVVSNTGRVFTNFTGTAIEEMDLGEGEVTGLFTRWIQHDALILPGNSGGPLVNLKGEVVGINELGGNGVGFAIPSNLAAKILNQVLALGEVRRGWLGVRLLPVEKLGRRSGALVASVIPGSPADAAGLRPGDLLLAIDGEEVAVRFFEQVPEVYQRIAELVPGEEVALRVRREAPAGDEVEVAVRAVPSQMEAFLGEQTELGGLGLTVRQVTGPMALARRYPNAAGVLITGMRPGYPFEEARPGFRAGDVITSVGGRAIRDLAAFRAVWEERADEEEVVVGYRRDQEELLTVVKPRQEDPKPQGGELKKAWLGVRTQVLTKKLAEALDLEGVRGFRVTQVYPGTEAAAAGLETGDVITAIDGEDLEAYRLRDARELQMAIDYLPIGEPAEVVVRRGERTLTLEVTMEPNPATSTEVDAAEDEVFELAVRELTFMDLVENRWPAEQEGVVVTEAERGGWASMAGIRIGDLIERINDRAVADAGAFEAVIADLLEAQPEVIRFFVRRGHRTTFVFLEPDWGAIEESH